jgi:hypothetical protein
MFNLLRNLAIIIAFFGVANNANAAATILPPPETCFSALAPTSGGGGGTGTGFIGLLGTITGGTGGITGTYGGVSLSGGHGVNATANVTVSGGAVTSVVILNPGVAYVVGDVLSATAANIGGVTGFVVPVSSVAINQSLAGGTVATYFIGTNTYKQTWFNADQASIHQNTNPVQLDANGCAIIIGIGSYRFVLQDSLGNIVYDQITTDTSSYNSVFWAGLGSGTPNAITVTDPGFNATDGAVINFIPLYTNTSATTLTPVGFGTYSIVKDTSTGTVSLTGGEIVAGSPSNVVSVVFSASQQNFHILNLVNPATSATTNPSVFPQGYLNLVGVANGGPVQGTADVTAAIALYYSPMVGNQVPIWNGTSFTILTFPELTINMTATSQVASTIYDVCVFNNAGAPVGVIGPAWSTSTAGSGARGSGAGTAQLTQQGGVWVNAAQITSNNGSTSYTIPALECTYVGSILIDGTAGQISSNRTFGQSRKFGVWNAYNRVPIVLQAGTSTASWTYASGTVRAANGDSTNSITTLVGLPIESVNVSYTDLIALNGLNASSVLVGGIGIGVNSTTVATGLLGELGNTYSFAALTGSPSSTISGMPVANYYLPPQIGVNVFTAVEFSGSVSGSNDYTFYGTSSHMLLKAQWNG